MYFKEFFIRDFGIFRHQKLENLNSNINIIGGLNRAGKTTFLEMIRYLPYGFPKKNNFIPANTKYDVEAVLEYEKQNYNLITKGYSSPLLKAKNKKENNIDITDIFGIDNFSYKQLYTISLDQLKRIPPNTSKNKEKLQSILLGAGFGELLELQDLKEDFINKAEKIGGKNGTINVKEFKEYYKEIKRGIKLRDEANNELAEFKNLKENLNAKRTKINKLKETIKELSLKQDRLDLLKNNFSRMKRIDQLTQNNNYIDFSNFNKINIDPIYKKLTSLSEKYKNYKENKKNISLKKQKILNELKNLNRNWDDESYLYYVLNLDFDFIENKEIDNYIYKLKNIRNNIEKLEEEKENTEIRISNLKEKINVISENINNNYNKKYFIISITATILGIIMIIFSLPIALIISFFGISSSYFYNKEKRNKVNFYKREKLKLEKELNEVKLKLDKLHNKINKERNKEEEITNILNKIKDKLDLKKDISIEVLRDYFKEINIFKDKIHEWEIRKNENEKNKFNLQKEFKKINTKLGGVNSAKKDDFEINEDISYLIGEVEKLKEWKKIKSNVLSTLKTDRAKNSFLNYNTSIKENENKLWNLFFDFYNNYLSKNDVEESYNENKQKLKKTKEKLDEEKNIKQNIKNKIDRLESSDKLKRARKIIFKNRKKLKNKAKEYAKNLTAGFIVDKVYNKILNEMKEDIFNLTSDYLEKITGNEYVKVMPAYDLKKVDFRTILDDGTRNESTKVLSRGTKEQLFLAVRLSRIKAMENKLPVIFDDSLVNFDSFHLENSLELITKISKNNQIFILTCHTDIIEKLKSNNKNISYWKLEKGKFDKTSQGKLVKYLKQNK